MNEAEASRKFMRYMLDRAKREAAFPAKPGDCPLTVELKEIASKALLSELEKACAR